MIRERIPYGLLENIHSYLGFVLPPTVYVAGGFIRSYYLNELPKDMDLYFESEKYIDSMRTVLISWGFFQTKDSGNAITMVSDFPWDSLPRKVQLCKNHYGTLESILDTFDFTICQIGVDGDEIVKCDSFDSDFLDRVGRYNIGCAFTSLKRLEKYQGKEFRFSGPEIEKGIGIIRRIGG